MKTSPVTHGQQRSERLFGWVAIGAVAWHGFALVALHVLAPQVNPLADMVSAYLGTPYQLMARSTFLAFAVALAALVLGLRSFLPPGVLPKVGVVLLGLAVIGFVGVAVAPGAALYFAIPTQPATIIGMLLLSLALRREARWRPAGGALVAISIALLGLFVLVIVLRILVEQGLGGLANRVVVVLIYAWVVLVARGLLAKPQPAA
jgi:hypothetical protein